MATIAFGVSNDGTDISGFHDTVVVRLTLPVGSYIIIGKTVLTNQDFDGAQNATARLTTMDGATELDRADIRISANDDGDLGAQEVSLQAALLLTNDSPDRIVDLRAQTYIGDALHTKLYAIQVDGMKLAD